MTELEELDKIHKRFKKLDKRYAMAGPVLKARLMKTGRRLQKREDHLKQFLRKGVKSEVVQRTDTVDDA